MYSVHLCGLTDSRTHTCSMSAKNEVPRIAVPFERRVFRGYTLRVFTKLRSAREDSRKLHDVDCAEIQKQSNAFAYI